MHQRVIPRDLFNEAKLLKCLGQVALLIHEGRGVRWPLRLEYEAWEGQDGFPVHLTDAGELFCPALTLYLGELEIPLFTLYNARGRWPLLAENMEDVLTEDGAFSAEFGSYLDSLKGERL